MWLLLLDAASRSASLLVWLLCGWLLKHSQEQDTEGLQLALRCVGLRCKGRPCGEPKTQESPNSDTVLLKSSLLFLTTFYVCHLFSCIFCSMNFETEELKMHSKDKAQSQNTPAGLENVSRGLGKQQ